MYIQRHTHGASLTLSMSDSAQIFKILFIMWNLAMTDIHLTWLPYLHLGKLLSAPLEASNGDMNPVEGVFHNPTDTVRL